MRSPLPPPSRVENERMDLETTDFGKGERRLGGRGERKLKKERRGASRIDRVVLPPSVPKRNEKERKRERERERKKVDTIIYTLDRIFMTFYNSEFLLLLLSLLLLHPIIRVCVHEFFFARCWMDSLYLLLSSSSCRAKKVYIRAYTYIHTHTRVRAHVHSFFYKRRFV